MSEETQAQVAAVKPEACSCTRVHVPTLAETLDCPAVWMDVPGQGWFHILPARRRAVTR